MGFDLLHVSVGESGCRRSGVVVGQSGIEGGEAFTVDASCCCVRGGKKSSTGTEIGARVKQLFGGEMQKGSVLAVHLEQPDADGDALREKPFGPRNCFFERCRLSFKGDGAAIPSLAAGELVGTVDAEGVGVKRRLSACDGFEGADGDVRRAGLRERLKGGRRNLGVGVGGGCLRKTKSLPARAKSVAKMILARRIRNWWPKAREDGIAAPSSRRWIAESPEYGCS